MQIDLKSEFDEIAYDVNTTRPTKKRTSHLVYYHRKVVWSTLHHDVSWITVSHRYESSLIFIWFLYRRYRDTERIVMKNSRYVCPLLKRKRTIKCPSVRSVEIVSVRPDVRHYVRYQIVNIKKEKDIHDLKKYFRFWQIAKWLLRTYLDDNSTVRTVWFLSEARFFPKKNESLQSPNFVLRHYADSKFPAFDLQVHRHQLSFIVRSFHKRLVFRSVLVR